MADFTVTPWEVSGDVDYGKLVKEFGTKRIDAKLRERLAKAAGGLHYMLGREYFFSHRDLDLLLDDCEKNRGFFLYTGRAPSGPMHIGHMMPMAFTKWLQDRFGVNLYIEISDDEKFVVKRELGWKEIGSFSRDNILDIIAAGFDPEKTFIFRNSEYVKNVYPLVLAVAKKTTFSTAKAVFGFTDSTNIGNIFYPAYQVVPTFFERKRCLIPCAIDQDPYWRIQRDVAEGMGYLKTAAIHSKFLPPLTGVEGKMSSSIADTAIWLHDDEKTVKNRISRYAFSGGRTSVEEHRRLGGNPDIDVSFQWLSIFFEPDDAKLKKIREDYASGKMLSGELKQILIERINKFLASHREKREKAKELVGEFMYEGKLAKEMWKRQF